jgi:CheY-like chemotaxis protein
MGEAERKAKDDAAANVGQATSGRILLAEDNKAIKDIVSRFLEFIGFEVALAGNGLEALSLFLKASFDLVLTDLDMPVMDGWGLTNCIKEKSTDTPVVLMTGEDRETILRNVERWPVDSVLFKPFTLEDLQSTVQGALLLRR